MPPAIKGLADVSFCEGDCFDYECCSQNTGEVEWVDWGEFGYIPMNHSEMRDDRGSHQQEEGIDYNEFLRKV